MTSLSDFVPAPWTQTHTGLAFDALTPDPGAVDIRDIAHALSQTCRFGRMAKPFYSVAEHSVHVSRIVPTIEALLHDAAEAYSPFGDVPRPYKHLFPAVRDVEDRIGLAIALHFCIDWPHSDDIKVADAIILADEKARLFPRSPRPWHLPYPAAGIKIECWSPLKAEYEFLKRFRELEG